MTKIIFELTNLCNFSCTYCIREEEGPKHYLPLTIVDKVLSETRAYRNVHFVAFTGGEPTLHPEFGEIVRRVTENGLPFSFVTNGWQFDKVFRQIEPYKKFVRNVSFSLDGARETTHDELRGRVGSYRRIMKAISSCRFHSMPVHLHMVVTTKNRGELEEMAILAGRLGVEALGYGHCQPTPDGLAAGLVPTHRERRRIESEVAALQGLFQIDIVLAGDHYTESLFHQCPQLRMEEFNIDYRGNLTTCCMLSNYRGGAADTDVVADLSKVSFYEAHQRLVGQIAEINREKIEHLAASEASEADHFICTHCLKRYDKLPHRQAATPKLVQVGSS